MHFVAILEQERQRIEQLTAGWDDPTRVDWGAEEAAESDDVSQLQRTPSVPLKCTALYSYTVSEKCVFDIAHSFLLYRHKIRTN